MEKQPRRKIFGNTISLPDAKEMSFVDHLEALRWHIIRALLVFVGLVILIFANIDWVFDNIILAPSQNNFISYTSLCKFSHWLHLGNSLCMPPVKMELQGNTVSGPFMSAISIGMVGGLILAFPYFVWEVWLFIKPALSAKELKYARGSIFWVSLCFFIGGAFGYYLLAPFTFNFMANFTLGHSGAYIYRPSLDDYIDTITNIILGCGIAFELPVVAFVLCKLGIITAQYLRKARKYAFVVILIVAAIITPSPDWTSQLIVTIPLILLYEISILLCLKVDKNNAKEQETWS